MSVILGVLQLVIIGNIVLIEFKRKSPVVFMWAPLLIMFGIMHALASIIGDEIYGTNILIFASVFVICFCGMYLFMRVFFNRKSQMMNKYRFQYMNLQAVLAKKQVQDNLCFNIFCASILLRIVPYLKNVGNILSSSWGSMREYLITQNYVNSGQILSILSYAMSGMIVIFLLKSEKVYFGIASVAIVLQVLLTKNRIEILPLLCAVIMVFIFKNKQIKPATIVVASLLAIVIIYIIYGLRVFRHYGTVEMFVHNFELNDFVNRINTYILTDNGELGLRRHFYFFIDGDNGFAGFGQMRTYLRMLLVYIPSRWSFGIKPDDFAIAMGTATGAAAGGSIHPTLFGDCFANLGVFGVVLGLFWGWYANFIDWLISRTKREVTAILIYAVSTVSYVIIARGSVYNGFWITAFSIPVIYAVVEVTSKIKVKFVLKR